NRRKVRRWSFVSELFHFVVLTDPAVQTTPVADARLELYRRRVLVAVTVCAAVLSCAFFVSWIGNRSLLHSVEAAVAIHRARSSNRTTIAELRELDALRYEVERLRNGASWWLHLGLYSGDAIIDVARNAYFRRFQDLILNDVSAEMTVRLKALP